MKRFAILFAGQGAQSVGMGLSALQETPSLAPYFNQIQQHLSFDLKSILNGQTAGINQTEFTQPSLLATSLLYYQQLQHSFPITPSYMIGFSLGEYTALHLAGHLDLANTLRLIQVRANAMAKASLSNPGSMAAILGLSSEVLDSICLQVNKTNHQVIIANYNSPGQLVISGHALAVKEVMAMATAQGAKRAIPLNVSGAFHSPLMADAGRDLSIALQGIEFQPSQIPMIFNWTGKPLPQLADLPHFLTQQIQSSVQFEASIRYLATQHIDTFLEIGPGTVLAGLVKKILPDAKVCSYNGLQDVPMVKELMA